VRPTHLTRALTLACLSSTGCLDVLGHEEDVTQRSDVMGTPQVEDDRIEDKHPTFDDARTVTETFGPGRCTVTMNKSAAVTKLDVVPFTGANAALGDTLFRGRREASAAVAAAAGTDAIPSMEVVNGYLKPFDDGLTAAVELGVEDDKRTLLGELLAALAALAPSANAAARPALDDATVLVRAAQILGASGGGAGAPVLAPALESRALARAAAFTATPLEAQPIGLYTWSPALEEIFTRDRFLQNGDDSESFDAFAALAAVLAQDATLRASYQRVTTLNAGLTNSYVSYTIDALVPYVPDVAALADAGAIAAAFRAANPPRGTCGSPLLAFLPASRSKETDLFNATFCGVDPGSTNLLDFLVAAIQSSTVDLAPGADSGWYDYQVAALETLLVPDRAPESQNLLLTAGYKKKLIETFKSILIENRETHVKDLQISVASVAEIPPVDIYPLLPAEPFPTFYLRTARAYRFLRTFLQAALPAGFLTRTARLVEDGGRAPALLGDELDQRIMILYGLAFLTADAVGTARHAVVMPDELREIDPAAAATAAGEFLSGWQMDPDVLRDPRVIVPVFVEADGTTRYWAVIGVKALDARAAFVAGHEPVAMPTFCWTGNIVPHDYTLLVEESVEVRLPAGQPPPTREKLRAICDAHTTKDQIVAALGSL